MRCKSYRWMRIYDTRLPLQKMSARAASHALSRLAHWDLCLHLIPTRRVLGKESAPEGIQSLRSAAMSPVPRPTISKSTDPFRACCTSSAISCSIAFVISEFSPFFRACWRLASLPHAGHRRSSRLSLPMLRLPRKIGDTRRSVCVLSQPHPWG